MFHPKRFALGLSLAAAFLIVTDFSLSAGAAKHPSACAVKAAAGTGESEKTAKFQVYEGLLLATDWGAWASFMANGTTPGYRVAPVKYKCFKGSGLGVSCRGQVKICKV